MKPKRRSCLTRRTKVSANRLRCEACKSRHHRIATRFLALADLVDGESCAIVSDRYHVSTSAVYLWIHQLNDRGIEGFIKIPQSGRRCLLDNRYGLGSEELASAAKGADLKSSRRLLAISRLLKGTPCMEVARDAHVTPSALTSWIRRFNEGGIAGLISNHRAQSNGRIVIRRDIPVFKIRAAAECAPRRTSRRLKAVAHILDGKKLADVAGPLNVSKSTVSKWCRLFHQGGIEGVFDRCEARAANISISTLVARE